MANTNKMKQYKKGGKIPKAQSTGKLLKQVKTDKYINEKTGEVEEVSKFVLESSDFNFEKIWIGHLMQSLDALGSKKLKVAMFLMSVRDGENYVNLTYQEMADATKISRRTVIDTIKILIEEKFMKKIRNGRYQINPDLVFKGGGKKRMSVLIEYNQIDNIEETQLSKDPNIFVQTDKDKEVNND